jgi:hypothetical protein
MPCSLPIFSTDAPVRSTPVLARNRRNTLNAVVFPVSTQTPSLLLAILVGGGTAGTIDLATAFLTSGRANPHTIGSGPLSSHSPPKKSRAPQNLASKTRNQRKEPTPNKHRTNLLSVLARNARTPGRPVQWNHSACSVHLIGSLKGRYGSESACTRT